MHWNFPKGLVHVRTSQQDIESHLPKKVLVFFAGHAVLAPVNQWRRKWMGGRIFVGKVGLITVKLWPFLDEDGMVLGSADKAAIRCRAGEERCLFEWSWDNWCISMYHHFRWHPDDHLLPTIQTKVRKNRPCQQARATVTITTTSINHKHSFHSTSLSLSILEGATHPNSLD